MAGFVSAFQEKNETKSKHCEFSVTSWRDKVELMYKSRNVTEFIKLF